MSTPVRLAFLLLLACLSACTAPDRAQAPASAPPAADRDAGAGAGAGEDPAGAARFRARGNEPFWAIDVEGDTLHYVTPDMPDGRTLRAQRMPHAKGVAFSGADEGRPFNLDLTRTACTDSMSGQAFEFTATWDYDGRRMEGCANRSD
ncbi:MAG TPA: hypothetical protein VM619_06470 [Luteimonas sp.]|nr:hypothetical protein [Luteimonas sp.]